jgi:hypothetical protein
MSGLRQARHGRRNRPSKGSPVRVHNVLPILLLFRLSLLLFQPCSEGAAPPRYVLGCQREPQIIFADIDQVSEPLQKPQHNKNVGKRPNSDTGITPFEAGDGTRRGSCAHGEIRHGDTTPQTRVADILAQSLQCWLRLGGTHLNGLYLTRYHALLVIYDELRPRSRTPRAKPVAAAFPPRDTPDLGHPPPAEHQPHQHKLGLAGDVDEGPIGDEVIAPDR